MRYSGEDWADLWRDMDCASLPVNEPEDNYNSIKYNVRKTNNVDHPVHYGGKYEVIDILKDKLTTEQFYGFLCGNVIKYVTRWQNKNGLEDLEKAEWYLSYLIKEIKDGEGTKE